MMLGRLVRVVAFWGVILLLSGELLSQESIRLGNFTLQLESNAKQVLQSDRKMRKLLGESLGGYYYTILQFKKIPDSVSRVLLVSSGVRLYDYLGSNAYYGRIPERGARKALRQAGVQSISHVRGVWKVVPELLQEHVPDYARSGWGIRSVLQVWEGFDEAWISQRLRELGIVYSEFSFSLPFCNFRLTANRFDLLRLSEEVWVKLVGLESPPSVAFDEKFRMRTNAHEGVSDEKAFEQIVKSQEDIKRPRQ